MSALRDLIAMIFGEASPEERARILRIAYRIAVSGSLLWAFGTFAPVGITGFARADEVDQKITAAIEPVSKQVAGVAAVQAQQGEVLKQIRIDQLGTKLRELHRVCCATPRADDISHERLNIEIEAAQREYRALTGERYPLPERCDDGKAP